MMLVMTAARAALQEAPLSPIRDTSAALGKYDDAVEAAGSE